MATLTLAVEDVTPPAITHVPLPDSEDNAIYFFGTSGPHGALSNFAFTPFRINGVSWSTVENYYQSQKFIGTDLETEIAAFDDPAEVRKLAKQNEKYARKDWSELKEKVMFAALLAKFSQHKQSRETLLNTKNAFLVEHSKKDAYWGDGHSNGGLNRLGVLLMEVRSMLRAELGLPTPSEDYVSEKKQNIEKKKEEAFEALLASLMEKSDEIDAGVIETSASPARTKRKLRTRPGTASKPFRSADGTPLFERDNATGNISVIDAEGPAIIIPPTALTPAARTVTFLYQFEKRNRREANMLEPEQVDAMEDALDEEEDWALAEQYAPPPIKPSLDDIVNENALDQLVDETELALVMATSLENQNSDEFAALALQLRTLRSELHKHVHRRHSERNLDRILTTIASVDSLIEN